MENRSERVRSELLSRHRGGGAVSNRVRFVCKKGRALVNVLQEREVVGERSHDSTALAAFFLFNTCGWQFLGRAFIFAF